MTNFCLKPGSITNSLHRGAGMPLALHIAKSFNMSDLRTGNHTALDGCSL